ncbi:MAG: Maf family protein [Lachnospiraceae bacterium]|nr:Maf family protein [Lachnospiraceae bacterium]
MRMILASASPRRRELLALLGLDYEVIPAEGEEHISKNEPSEVVEELAMTKATEVYEKLLKEKEEPILVIGADTVVVDQNQILGKPKDAEDAVSTLNRLQNHTHQVYTGVAIRIWRDGKSISRVFHEKTDVTMYPMTTEEIMDYVSGGEPMDKAGSYGIQGQAARFVKSICGDYNNVVGLPVARLYQELKEISYL